MGKTINNLLKDTIQTLKETDDISIGEVLEVSTDKKFLKVKDINKGTGDSDFIIEGVQIAVSQNKDKSLLLVPEIGSLGVLLPFGNSTLMTGFSSLTEINLMGNDNGGIVKVSELTDKLNNIEDDINDLKSVLTNWVPTPQDGGLALKQALLNYYTSPLVNTSKKDLENEKIKH